MSETTYIFVIDTDSYSGNFEREMCACVTGQIGECGVGGVRAEAFKNEEPQELLGAFEDKIGQMQDEYGCYRPCAIGRTPGYGNDGRGDHKKIDSRDDARSHPYPAYQSVEIYFNEKPTVEMRSTMVRRARNFVTEWRGKKITILSFRFIERTTVVTDTEVSVDE